MLGLGSSINDQKAYLINENGVFIKLTLNWLQSPRSVLVGQQRFLLTHCGSNPMTYNIVL